MTEWGRIDDDGTVYVTTADGERSIGSWQAGDKEAGLAFYMLRFDDLEAEVRVLEKRLESGVGDAASTQKKATALKEHLTTAAAIGNFAALDERLVALLGKTAELAGVASAAKAQAKAQALASKQKLVAEAEKIAESATSWKTSGDRMRVIVDEWRQIKGVDRKTDDSLWKRYSAARDAFGRRRGQHFSQLDTERGSVKDAKEKLIVKAAELAQSSEWKETAEAMKDLMAQWKSVGRAGRDVEDELWTRFRAAQDVFFARRSETFSERDAEQVANQRLKEAIIAKADSIDVAKPSAAQSALRVLQAEFDEIGHVPRDAMRRLDDAMRRAEQRIRDAVDAEWRQGSANSNPFLAALRERLVEAEAKLERARKAGDANRIAKAEAEVEQRRSLIPE